MVRAGWFGTVALALALGACGGDDGTSDTSETSVETQTESGTETGSDYEYCNLGSGGNSGGASGPWLEVWHQGQPIADGMSLRLICGGQGAWMFQLDPFVGGYDPQTEYVTLGSELDLDSFNIYEQGHFAFEPNNEFLVGCKEEISGPGGGGFDTDDLIPILLPDQLSPMPHVLEGVPGTLRVWLEADGQTIEESVSLTVDAPLMGAGCGYG